MCVSIAFPIPILAHFLGPGVEFFLAWKQFVHIVHFVYFTYSTTLLGKDRKGSFGPQKK